MSAKPRVSSVYVPMLTSWEHGLDHRQKQLDRYKGDSPVRIVMTGENMLEIPFRILWGHWGNTSRDTS